MRKTSSWGLFEVFGALWDQQNIMQYYDVEVKMYMFFVSILEIKIQKSLKEA